MPILVRTSQPSSFQTVNFIPIDRGTCSPPARTLAEAGEHRIRWEPWMNSIGSKCQSRLDRAGAVAVVVKQGAGASVCAAWPISVLPRARAAASPAMVRGPGRGNPEAISESLFVN